MNASVLPLRAAVAAAILVITMLRTADAPAASPGSPSGSVFVERGQDHSVYTK